MQIEQLSFNKQPFMSSVAQKRNFSSCFVRLSRHLAFFDDEKCCDFRAGRFGIIYFDSSNNATQEKERTEWLQTKGGGKLMTSCLAEQYAAAAIEAKQ